MRVTAFFQRRIRRARSASSIWGSQRLSSCQLARELVEVLPESDREAGRVGRAEGRGLGHHRAHDRNAQDVGLELHEGVIHHHAAVDLQLGQGNARRRR